jgi:hypothetical protein
MRVRIRPGSGILAIFILSWIFATSASCGTAQSTRLITVESLLLEMVDLGNLAVRPEPFFKQAQSSSYDRDSHKGGEAWFANRDVGHYIRTETTAGGRREHVLADLKGPGTITRFWSANPARTNTTRFYFDGEAEPRLVLPLADLFKGLATPFEPDFSYVSGTGGNLYFPLPYAASLRITVEETPDSPLRLYYEIGYRTYDRSARRDVRPGERSRLAEDRGARRRQARATRFHRAIILRCGRGRPCFRPDRLPPDRRSRRNGLDPPHRRREGRI